jgi:hypothetical protein
VTTASEEFADLMPHRIEVSGEGETTYDDYGQPVNVAGGTREYMCLLDDSATTVRTASGTEVTISLTAYVAPVPMNEDILTPVDIDEDEKIVVTVPDKGEKHIISVERHYDSEFGVGMLHNLVVRMQ